MNASRLAQTCSLSPSPGAARQQLQSMLESANWPGDVEGVVLAVHEALINSHRHAGGATSATAGLDGRDLVVEVCDSGPGFDLDHHAHGPPDAMAERGRGLWLINSIADTCEVRRQNGKTCLSLRFHP